MVEALRSDGSMDRRVIEESAGDRDWVVRSRILHHRSEVEEVVWLIFGDFMS